MLTLPKAITNTLLDFAHYHDTATKSVTYNSGQKSWGTSQSLYSVMKSHPPPPLKQCYVLGEVLVIMGKFHVRANFKFPKDEPTFSRQKSGACILQR